MMQISYPASNRGVEIARIPSGAVASMLEKEATKKTIFLEDFTVSLLVSPQLTNGNLRVCLEIVKTLQNPGWTVVCHLRAVVGSNELWRKRESIETFPRSLPRARQARATSWPRL